MDGYIPIFSPGRDDESGRCGCSIRPPHHWLAMATGALRCPFAAAVSA